MVSPAKKQKTEEAPGEGSAEAEGAKEEQKEPELPKELEVDAPECKDKRTKELPTFLLQDTTLNVIQSTNNNVLMCLAEGGIQHFMAGARANLGICKGRYAFEVKVVQLVNTAESISQSNNRSLVPRSVIRIGFSTAGSELVLGESEEHICFESEGVLVHNKTKSPGMQKFTRGDVVAVVLNLDKNSVNFNTISLFKDGVRASQPIPLPEKLKGKTLFPHVSYKCAAVHVNFGPDFLAPLPFTCRPWRDASDADVTVTKPPVAPADGKYSVVFPVSLPDEGTFDWLDMFLEKNPHYVELSDRKVLEWAEMSGIWKPKGYNSRTSNDKPDMNFQVRELDDFSMQRAVWTVAPLQKRHYVVMEIRCNLLKEERAELLAKFHQPHFKRVAHIVMGEPNTEFKRRTTSLLLQERQEASDRLFELKRLEEKRKKQIEKRQKEMARARKQVERTKRKAEREAKRQAEEEAKAKAAAERAEAKRAEEAEKEDQMDEEATEKKEKQENEEEEKAKEPQEEDESEQSEEEEEKEEPENDVKPPQVELTAEEKKVVFRRMEVKDLAAYALSASFMKFTLPDKEEGFEEIKYDWAKTNTKCKDYLAQWILDRKITTRMEDIVPSQWFHQKWKDWQTVFQAWLTKLNDYKADVASKASERAARQAAREARTAKKPEEAEAGDNPQADDGGEEVREEKECTEEGSEKKEKEKEVEPMEDEEEEKQNAKADESFEALDVFGVQDILNIGNDVPLFREFQHEDWTMTALRFELYLLAHAVRKDAGDPERPGIHIDHLAFYYGKYYKRTLSTRDYGIESFKEIVEMVDDTIFITPRGILEPLIDGELENPQVFAKLAEEARRHRAICLDLGEESALLRLSMYPQWQGQGHRGNQRWYQGNRGPGGYRNQQPWQYAVKGGGAQNQLAGQSQGPGQWQAATQSGSSTQGANQYQGANQQANPQQQGNQHQGNQYQNSNQYQGGGNQYQGGQYKGDGGKCGKYSYQPYGKGKRDGNWQDGGKGGYGKWKSGKY